jgi:hypothetical protein
VLLFRNYKAAVLGTGLYLLLGFSRGLSLTADLITDTVSIAGLKSPNFNLLSLGLLLLFLILHMGILIDMQLDYKERQAKLKNP